MEDRYYGIGEASKTWGVPISTLKRWCANGDLRCVKVSGRWLIEKYGQAVLVARGYYDYPGKDQKKPEKMREDK